MAEPHLLDLGEHVVDEASPGHHLVVGRALGDGGQWLRSVNCHGKKFYIIFEFAFAF